MKTCEGGNSQSALDRYLAGMPVVAMCGQRWGLDMTATTAMPDAVLIGLAFNLRQQAPLSQF